MDTKQSSNIEENIDHQILEDPLSADITNQQSNNLLEKPVENCTSPKNEQIEEEGGDLSTDSDRGTFVILENEDENKRLVNQESFEELPYVPTTLPLERFVFFMIINYFTFIYSVKYQYYNELKDNSIAFYHK